MEGERWKVVGKIKLTAAVFTQHLEQKCKHSTSNDWDRRRKRCVWCRLLRCISASSRCDYKEKEAAPPQLFSDNTKFPQSEWIPPWLSFTAVQLIGLILPSVPLKARCICPPAAPKGRKHNTSKPDARLLANFKEILGECVALWCLSPVTAKVTHVTGTAVLFMVLDLPLLKLLAALLFAPHLLTTNTYNWETHIDSQTNVNY